MKKLSIFFLALAASHACFAQVAGGAASYGQGRGSDAQANERAKREISRDEMPPNATSMFVDASVLINVKADEYVAVFGISQEGATPDECNAKMNATLAKFMQELKQIGVSGNDTFVDYIAQTKTYGFTLEADVAREKLVGFELKKNVSIHYKAKSFLDKLTAAASRADVYDLIKVDYIVGNIEAMETKLMEEAARVIKRKMANYDRLLGIKLRQPAQVYAEKYSTYFPSEAYASYVAQESEDVSNGYLRQRFAVQSARKTRTFYFNPLSAKGFDRVVNPVVIEPVVQFTLYLKVRYESGKAAAPAKKLPR